MIERPIAKRLRRQAFAACVVLAFCVLITFAVVGLGRQSPALAAEPTSGGDGRAGAPLVAGGASHIVVMEYEAWFGPNAVTFPPPALSPRPLLTSADMVPVGGGYDSADPHVIETHVKILESMSVDAVTLDLTNDVSCTFDTGGAGLDPALLNPCAQTTPAANRQFQLSLRQIAGNVANLYHAWSGLRTSLKIIPLLGCQDNGCLTRYSGTEAPAGFGPDPCPALAGLPAGNLTGNPAVKGTTSFEKEMSFFENLMAKYPGLDVIYDGKPLVLVFAPPGIDDDACLMQGLHDLISTSGLGSKFTFRMVGGLFDTDRIFWNEPANFTPTGPVPLEPGFGALWWSYDDRLDPKFSYYPTYNPSPVYRRVENFTASVADGGQDGWGTWPAPCKAAPPKNPPLTTCQPGTDYYVDDTLRNQGGVPYSTFAHFMTDARALDPIFLLIGQYNEFSQPDEGWDANSTDDIEPANDGIGYGGVNAVGQEILRYRLGASRRRPR